MDKNENMHLKVLELIFYRKRSTKKMLLFFSPRKNDGKDREKFVFGGKLVQFPNNVQLSLNSYILNEKRALSFG